MEIPQSSTKPSTCTELTALVLSCIISRNAGQQLSCFCPGSLHHQGISSHIIDYEAHLSPCLTWRRISTQSQIWEMIENEYMFKCFLKTSRVYINDFVQDCGNSSANALELPQFWTKPSQRGTGIGLSIWTQYLTISLMKLEQKQTVSGSWRGPGRRKERNSVEATQSEYPSQWSSVAGGNGLSGHARNNWWLCSL